MPDSAVDDRGPITGLRDRIDLAAVRRVVVHDGWWGMADGYTMRRLSSVLVRDASGGFVGDFRAVCDDRDVMTAQVRMPPRAAKSLLARVGGALLVPGAYTPRIHRTDDYPDIEILVETESRLAYLFSKSQGEWHAPWGACIGGEVFTSPGDEIGRAVQMVRRLVPRQAWESRTSQRMAQQGAEPKES
jgi:hypothetical protein